MDKIIQELTHGGNDYKLKPEHISGLPAALQRLVSEIEYNPETRQLILTDDAAKKLAVELTLATAKQAGLMSAAMYDKLDKVEEGAQKNTVTSVNGQTGAVTVREGSDYTLPAATASELGGVKIGSNISNSGGTISLTRSNVTSALGTSSLTIANLRAGKADTLTFNRTINGFTFDGSANVNFGGTCTTAAGTAAKTVDIDNFTLTTYATICVMFRYVNTAENPTLNVNGSGAKPIYKGNAATTNISTAEYEPVVLQYYNNAWHIIASKPDGLGSAVLRASCTGVNPTKYSTTLVFDCPDFDKASDKGFLIVTFDQEFTATTTSYVFRLMTTKLDDPSAYDETTLLPFESWYIHLDRGRTYSEGSTHIFYRQEKSWRQADRAYTAEIATDATNATNAVTADYKNVVYLTNANLDEIYNATDKTYPYYGKDVTFHLVGATNAPEGFNSAMFLKSFASPQTGQPYKWMQVLFHTSSSTLATATGNIAIRYRDNAAKGWGPWRIFTSA